jgi:hypothetical protein
LRRCQIRNGKEAFAELEKKQVTQQNHVEQLSRLSGDHERRMRDLETSNVATGVLLERYWDEIVMLYGQRCQCHEPGGMANPIDIEMEDNEGGDDTQVEYTGLSMSLWF